MKKINSVKNLCDVFFEFEDKFNLLHEMFDDVYLWQYLRMEIYYTIAFNLKILDIPHNIDRNINTFFSRRFSNLLSSILKSPLYCKKKKNYIVFDHARSKKVDGEHVDIYSYYLVKELLKNENFIIVERPLNDKHIRKKHEYSFRLDIVNFIYFKDLIFGSYKISKLSKTKIYELNNNINKIFNCKISFINTFIKGIIRHKSNYDFYKKLLSRVEPKTIFLVNAYGPLAPLISAAKDHCIQTIELQHGVFSQYHLGYNYPGRPELKYFPDYLYTWGKFWNTAAELPLDDDHVVEKGFTYFHEMKATYSVENRSSDRVVVISQGVIGERLASEIASFLINAPEIDIEILYKFHPGEYGNFSNYSSYSTLNNDHRVTILDHDCSLYQVFSECQYQIGVFSTAIYEGIGMGCRTILMDLPGVEYMEEIVKSGHAVLCKKGEQLSQALQECAHIDIEKGSDDLFGRVWENDLYF